MALTLSPSDESTLVVLAIVFLFLARRTYRMVRGMRYSAARLFVYSGLYVLLFVLFAFITIYAATSAWGMYAESLVVPYGAVVAAAAVLSTPFVRRIVRFERREDGREYYRLPWVVPVLSLVLFVVRFTVELFIFGLASTTSFFLPTSLPTVLLLVLIVIDLLFGVSVGLLLGRAVGVRSAHEELASAPAEPPRSPPLPEA